MGRRGPGPRRRGHRAGRRRAETVAERMREYADLGIETFILSGYPHLEEAYRVAELLFPLLPLGHKSTAGRISLTGPFGEIIANEHAPRASAS